MTQLYLFFVNHEKTIGLSDSSVTDLLTAVDA